jgi:hypothetical protein
MNTFHSVAMLVALLLGWSSRADANGAAPAGAIESLVACSEQLDAAAAERADEARLVELVGAQTGKGSEVLAAAGACLDQKLAPALDEAQGAPDLLQALKDYFVAAQSYREALDDVSGGLAGFVSRTRRAGEPHTSALQRVRMEVMLNPSKAEVSSEPNSPSA